MREKMVNRLLFELNKEELIALRDTLNYAINIVDEVEEYIHYELMPYETKQAIDFIKKIAEKQSILVNNLEKSISDVFKSILTIRKNSFKNLKRELSKH